MPQQTLGSGTPDPPDSDVKRHGDNPFRSPSTDRIGRLDKVSGGFLPSRMILKLAEGSLNDTQLDRAATMLGRQFDLNPADLLNPAARGLTGRVLAYRDPATGGVLSLGAARRFLRVTEVDIMRKMLGQAVRAAPQVFRLDEAGNKTGELTAPGIVAEPRRVVKVLRAMAPLDGDRTDLPIALGMALKISRDGDLDLDLFQRNLSTTARFESLRPTMQVAAAEKAARNGRVINTPADIAKAILPTGFDPLIDRSERQAKAEAKLMRTENVARRGALVEGRQVIEPGATSAGLTELRERVPELELGEAVVAGISGPNDWLKVLQDSEDDYVKAAEEITQGATIPFSDSVFGHVIAKGIDYINRPFDAVFRVLATGAVNVPILGGYNRKVLEWAFDADVDELGSMSDAYRDVLDITHGRTTSVEQLKAYGIPEWYTMTSQLAINFLTVPVAIPAKAGAASRTIALNADPLQALLSSRALFKADHLISGLAANGKAAEWTSRVAAFVDGPVRKLGGLSDVTVTEYLTREALRVDEARFFGRATDNFRRFFGAGSGIDPTVASRIWRFTRNGKKIGLSAEQLNEGVRSVLYAAMGVPPEAGSLADEIRVLAQADAMKATDQAITEILSKNPPSPQTQLGVPTGPTVTPGAEIMPAPKPTPEGRMALSALTDAELDFARGTLRMTEVPHVSGAWVPGPAAWNSWLRNTGLANTSMGRVARSVLQTSPVQYGPNLVLNIEDADVVRDYERALLRSQEYSPDEITELKLQFARITDRTNPIREIEFAEFVGKTNLDMRARINLRYGIDSRLEDAITRHLTERFGGKAGGRRNAFGTFLADEAERIQSRNLQRQLARGATGEERAAIEARLRDLTTAPTTTVHDPYLSTQFNNSMELMDPVLYRLGIAEVAGTWKKWTRGLKADLGIERTALTVADEVRVPLRTGLDRLADGLITGLFMGIWKPLAVLRPAYVLRVVGIEENTRFLATAGLTRRLAAGKRTGPLAERLGLTQPRYYNTGMALPEQYGARENSIEDAIYFLAHRHKAGVLDNIGFDREDADVGMAIAEYLRTGGELKGDQLEAALEILARHPVQLRSAGIDVDKLTRRTVDPEGALARQIGVEEGVLRFPVPGMLPDETLANNSVGRFAINSENSLDTSLQNLRPGKWTGVHRDEDQFRPFLFNFLKHQLGADPIGRQYLEAFNAGLRNPDEITARVLSWLGNPKNDGPLWARRLMHGVEDYSPEMLESQVRVGVQMMLDVVEGNPVLARLAYSQDLTMDVIDAIDPNALPLYVPGPEAEVTMGVVGEAKKFRDWAGRWILQEPTNRLTRQPFFKTNYDAMYRALVENAGGRGGMTAEQLAGFRETARQFGISQVKRVMFDFSRTGRLEELTRFMLVFLQPYLEFPLAWGRIIRQNPAFAGHALRLGQAGLKSGLLREDPDTGQLVVPMSWWAGAAPLLAMFTGTSLQKTKLQGGGWELAAPLTAFNLFAQGTFPLPVGSTEVPIPMPSLAPPFMMLMQQLVKRNDIDASFKARLSSWLFEYGEVGPGNVQGLMPGWLRHGLTAAFPDQYEQTVNFNSTHFLQVQEAMGLTPDIDLATKQAREFSALRMFFSWVFPAAPKIEFPTNTLEQEYRALTDEVNGLGYLKGKERWLELHPDLRLLTIARTVWNGEDPNDPLRSPVPIPANRLTEQFLNTRGAKAFAERYPRWTWAIIPEELYDEEFDPGVYFAQIARGEREVLSPGAFLASGKVQDGWDLFFAEDERWKAVQARLEDQGIGEGDPGYVDEDNDHKARLRELMAANPTWGDEYRKSEGVGVKQGVLATARNLARDPTFSRTEVGKALGQYLDLYDDTYDALSDVNLSTLKSVTAERLGITKMYDDGVASILEDYPGFETAMRLFFDTALQADVQGRGDKLIDRLPEGRFDDVINPWWETWEELRLAPNMAQGVDERNAAYSAQRLYVNNAYEQFSKGENPMILRWETMNPSERGTYLVGVVGRSYQFLNRFDKETIFGEATSQATENLWTTYEQLRAAISQREATDADFSASDAYENLDAWVLAASAESPEFGAQVAAANEWGHNFKAVQDQLFTETSPDAEQHWSAFLDAVGQLEQVAYQYGLHGLDDPDLENRAVYTALRSQLIAYKDELVAASPDFAAQWDYLERESGPDAAVSWFMPDIYYPLGGSPADREAA